MERWIWTNTGMYMKSNSSSLICNYVNWNHCHDCHPGIIIRNRVEIHLRQLVKWDGKIEQDCYSFFSNTFMENLYFFNKFEASYVIVCISAIIHYENYHVIKHTVNSQGKEPYKVGMFTSKTWTAFLYKNVFHHYYND